MTNKEAFERARKAIDQVYGWRDDGDGPVIGDLSTPEIDAVYREALAYVFKQGPQPYWWDDIVE